MAKLKLVRGGPPRYTLVYGMRLFPAGDVSLLAAGRVGFARGDEARVTLHVIEGTRAQIEKQLLTSIDAFFDLHGKDAPPG
jgi:hypothetical protein